MGGCRVVNSQQLTVDNSNKEGIYGVCSGMVVGSGKREVTLTFRRYAIVDAKDYTHHALHYTSPQHIFYNLKFVPFNSLPPSRGHRAGL